ncbi:MFS general substrate transporter [Dichomitus squalens]|nr:MFS general substrate transporter [Dichomitus squalens]
MIIADPLRSPPLTANSHSKQEPTHLEQDMVVKNKNKEDVVTETVLAEDGEEAHDCPDGGLRAWLVVVGLFCGMVGMIGIINAWGTFQAYYQEVKLPQRSSSDIAWIGSIQNGVIYVVGLPLGRLFDMGYLKLPMLLASALFIACLFLTAECTEYWQFLLCQGFGMGIASGVLFNMGNMLMTHWFKRRLGLALACMFAGASIGGCIFPIIVRTLLGHRSFQWTMRILGFIALGLLAVTNVTIAGRLPPKQGRTPLVSVAEFKRPAYSIYVSAWCISNLGLWTCMTYLTLSAVDAGLNATLAFNLLAILNATSTLGRISSGILADRYGPLNILVPASLIVAVVTYAWPFAKSTAAFVMIAVLIGVSSGAILAIVVQPFARLGSVTNVGMRIGMGSTITAIGAIAGPPIAGAILDATGSFKDVGYYAGSMLLLSTALIGIVRRFVIRIAWVGEHA